MLMFRDDDENEILHLIRLREAWKRIGKKLSLRKYNFSFRRELWCFRSFQSLRCWTRRVFRFRELFTRQRDRKWLAPEIFTFIFHKFDGGNIYMFIFCVWHGVFLVNKLWHFVMTLMTFELMTFAGGKEFRSTCLSSCAASREMFSCLILKWLKMLCGCWDHSSSRLLWEAPDGLSI